MAIISIATTSPLTDTEAKSLSKLEPTKIKQTKKNWFCLILMNSF